MYKPADLRLRIKFLFLFSSSQVFLTGLLGLQDPPPHKIPIAGENLGFKLRTATETHTRLHFSAPKTQNSNRPAPPLPGEGCNNVISCQSQHHLLPCPVRKDKSHPFWRIEGRGKTGEGLEWRTLCLHCDLPVPVAQACVATRAEAEPTPARPHLLPL